MIEPTLKLEPSGYRVNPEKLKGASQSILPYLFSCFYFKEEFEYFDKIKPYLDIPEPRKSLDEISKELDEKFEELLVKTKRKFDVSKQTAEYHYDHKFDIIIGNFEYAKEHGEFRPKLSFIVGDGLSVNSSINTSFVINTGTTEIGCWCIDPNIQVYLKKKPNFIVRYFSKLLLNWKWKDT